MLRLQQQSNIPNNNSHQKGGINVEFECRRKIKTESDKGTIYKVRFRSREGHELILASLSFDIFEGYQIGTKITVDITNPQTIF